MTNLDGTDFVQLIAIVATLVLGVFANFIEIKTRGGKYNKNAFILLVLLFISLGTVIGSTISKSIDDKKNYNKLKDKSDSTLTQVDMNLQASNKALSNSDTSLRNLNILLKDSRSLNDSLAKQLRLQKEISVSSQELLIKNRIMFKGFKTEATNRLDQYDKSLMNTTEEIIKLYNYVEFKLIAMQDSINKIDKIREITLSVSRLMNLERTNLILNENKVLLGYWTKIEFLISDLNFKTSVYGINSISDAHSNLSRYLRGFSSVIHFYAMNNNNSFKFNPQNPTLLNHIEEAEKNLY